MLPAALNYLAAGAVPLAAAIALYVPWDAQGGSAAWALRALDLTLAAETLRPLMYPFLRANMRATSVAEEAADPGVYAARSSSAIGSCVIIVLLVAHLLGRTVLVLFSVLKVLLLINAGCWSSTVTHGMQAGGGGRLLPEAFQRLLSASPRELLTPRREPPGSQRPAATATASSWPSRIGDIVWAARTLTPVILASEEHRGEAFALLPPRLLAALEQPIGQQLPPSIKELIGPWMHSAHLRPRPIGRAADARGTEPTHSPPASDHSLPCSAAAATSMTASTAAANRCLHQSHDVAGIPSLESPTCAVTSDTKVRGTQGHHSPPTCANGPEATAGSFTRPPVDAVRSRLAPELLLVRLATQGLRRLALRRVAAVRNSARSLAARAYNAARELALVGPTWVLRLWRDDSPVREECPPRASLPPIKRRLGQAPCEVSATGPPTRMRIDEPHMPTGSYGVRQRRNGGHASLPTTGVEVS